MLIFGVACANAIASSTFGYDGQTQPQTGYDASCNSPVFGYDGRALLAANGNNHHSISVRAFLGEFAEFLAAEGIGATTWQEYESAVNNMYGGQAPYAARQFSTAAGNWVADNVVDIGGNQVAIESKFIGSGGWARSPCNPASAVVKSREVWERLTEVRENGDFEAAGTRACNGCEGMVKRPCKSPVMAPARHRRDGDGRRRANGPRPGLGHGLAWLSRRHGPRGWG